jgi:hypothetical protein
MESDSRIKVKYKFDKNYNPKYANGAFGGVNPLGEIIMNFYLERKAIPISTTLKLKEDKPTNEVLEFEPEDLDKSMIRFVETGVILNYEVAKEIHRFLGESLKHLEMALSKQ